MLVRNSKTVGLLGLVGLLLGVGCGQTRAPSMRSAPAASPSETVVPPVPSASAQVQPITSSRADAPTGSSSATAAGGEPASRYGAAYFGCGAPIPRQRLWDESTEAQVLEAIGAAKACARVEHRYLLLEFVAPWCADCREMAELDETAVVADALRARFERVRINVGKWDRHEALRENFGVRALATYIVLDPSTSKLLARTTLEPITKRAGTRLTAEDWARWLRSQPPNH